MQVKQVLSINIDMLVKLNTTVKTSLFKNSFAF